MERLRTRRSECSKLGFHCNPQSLVPIRQEGRGGKGEGGREKGGGGGEDSLEKDTIKSNRKNPYTIF